MLKSGFVVLATLLLLLSTASVQAQLVGANVGLNYNSFSSRGTAKIEDHTPGNGVGFQLNLEDLDNKGLKLGLALQFEYYQGGFKCINGGPASSQVDEGFTERFQMGIGLLPLQLVLFKRLQLQLGAELNILLSHKTSGKFQGSYPGSFVEIPYSNKSYQLHNSTTLGVVGKVAYRIPLKSSWLIVPQVRYHYGLQPDMSAAGSIYSSRAVFACGLLYQLHKR